VKILAIDPATACGWAHSTGPVWGTWDLSIRSDESSGMRLIRFTGKLREIYRDVGIDVIVYEGATVAGSTKGNLNGFKLIDRLGAQIMVFAEEMGGIECRPYNLGQIKSFAGCRKKDEMVAAAQARWGPGVEDDNQADALWLLALAQRDLGE
jgi:hypothetical protein